MSDLKQEIIDSYLNSGKSMSWLISGTQGCGKHHLVRGIIQTLFDKNTANITANTKWIQCGLTDESEKKIQKALLNGDTPPNQDELSYKTEITVADIRSGITFLSMKTPLVGKVLVVDLAENMNENAQNALLKTLEEPYDKTLIFLLSENTARLLPTVLSRCQKIILKNLSDGEILGRIQHTYPTVENPEEIMKLSSGIWGIAQSICENDGLVLYTELNRFITNNQSLSISEVISWTQQVSQNDKLWALVIYFLGQIIYQHVQDATNLYHANRLSQLYTYFYQTLNRAENLYLDKSQFLFNTITHINEVLFP